MKTRVPVTITVIAAVLGSAASGHSIMRHLGAAPAGQTLAPIETVSIAPGTFSFRSPGEYLLDGRPVDGPKRRVEFRKSLEIMKFQVGADDYARCVADGACEEAESKTIGDTPVTGVSYRDAEAYASWLSTRTGETWRLPSDEEWSFVAAERLRDDALNLANDDDNPATRWLARYRSEAAGKAQLDSAPKPRGHFGANSKGVVDIAGNVWEWTSTCYLNATLATDAKSAGIWRSVENCGVRVVDGRHRGYMSTFIRDGRSGGCAAGLAPDNLGIRLVRAAPSLFATVRAAWTKVLG